MHNDVFHDTSSVITWKIPGAKFVVDGAGMDGVLREGSWEGPEEAPSAETIEEWKAEFLADGIGDDLEAESRMTDQGVAAMFAVFEATTGSPPTEAEKVTLRDTMKHNLMHGHV